MADAVWRTMIRDLCANPGAAESLIPNPTTRIELAVALLGGSLPSFRVDRRTFVFTSEEERARTLEQVWHDLPQAVKDEYGGTGDPELDELLDNMETESEFADESPWQEHVRLRSTDLAIHHGTPDVVSEIVNRYLAEHGWVSCEACGEWVDLENGTYLYAPEGIVLCSDCSESDAAARAIGECVDCNEPIYPNEDHAVIQRLSEDDEEELLCAVCDEARDLQHQEEEDGPQEP